MKSLRLDFLTIFPEMVEPYLNGSILGRAQKSRLLKVAVHQLRQWTHDRHQSVDDRPFGGGPGMVMKVAPFHEALVTLGVRKQNGSKTAAAKQTRVILMSAKGTPFTQSEARSLLKYNRLVFLCGRYEGVDERVAAKLADEELSIGPYVLTGGELPALVVADAVARLRPGVLGNEASLVTESHNVGAIHELPLHEYPQYTRPEVYPVKKGKGWRVPKILMSGNHQKIAEWRKNQQR